MPQCVTGGPAIDYNGEVVGMASLYARQAIIPSFIIFKCWHFWKRFKYVILSALLFCSIGVLFILAVKVGVYLILVGKLEEK
jgi:uncharacterized membrane protein